MGLEQLYRRRCPHDTHLHGHDYDHDATDDEETAAAVSGSPSPPPVPRRYISSLRARNRRSGSLDTSNCDPQTRLTRSLRAFYRDLAACDTATSSWAPALPPAALCPAYFRPALELDVGRGVEAREPIGLCDLLSPITTKSNVVLESPRKVLVEGAPGSGKTALALRLLHSWATQNSWWGPSISVALFVPLRELRGRSICQYLCKELLPRSAAVDLPQLWNRFAALEDRLLFVLDGYDEAVGPTASIPRLGDDAHELLCGRLFPECRLVVTSCPEYGDRLAPFVQRKVRLLGREWSQVERFVGVYFGGPRADRLLKMINDNKEVLKPLAQAPLGWLCLCLLYEESPHDFPKDLLRVYESLTQCLIKRRIRMKQRSSYDSVPAGLPVPERSLAEFGRLALTCIKSGGRYAYTEPEVRQARRRAGLDVAGFGLLNRSATFGKRARNRNRDHIYTLVHPSFAEYLAARHVMQETAQGGPIALRRELESLPGIGQSRQLNASTILILRFLMGMLGPRGHLILDLLCPLDVSTGVVLLLLKEAGAHRGNVSTVCRLLAGHNPNGEWPRVHTTPAELEGWTYVLLSGHCTLDRLELVYQLGNLESAYLEMFFKALSFNDSIRMVKISSLLDEWMDIAGLAANVSTALNKTRLSSFELVVTCLQEDTPERNRFQCVVDEICTKLSSRVSRLDRLVLDLNLSSSQVQQLCRALETGRGVSVLHLPHLCLDTDTAGSIARLVLARPLAALNVTGSWSAHEDVPSSSGVSSMGSGSKLSPNGGCPSPPHLFSSLPRGTMGAHCGGTRPATLPRQPLLEQSAEGKRLSDSLVWQRHFHYPGCEPGSHHGFHKIFEAVRDARCVLDHLNVSRCVFSGNEDAACLGESVRRSRTLHSLRMEGFTRFAEVLPIVLALADNGALQLLDLGSSRVTLEDSQTQLVCKSLARNSSLRTLNLDGWTYRLEEDGTLRQALSLVASTRLVELILDNGRLHLASNDAPGTGSLQATSLPTFRNEALRHLRMSGLQVTLNDKPVLYGPSLLPFLIGFTSLAHLDLSTDKSQANTVDDSTLLNFFTTLARHFKSLKVLIINNWVLQLENYEKTFRGIRKALETCVFTVLKMHALKATHTVKRTAIEHLFLRLVAHGVTSLLTLDLSAVALTRRQAEHFAKTLKIRPSERSLDVNLDGLSSESVKTLVMNVKTNPKLQVTYLGGLSCVIRVHRIRDKQLNT